MRSLTCFSGLAAFAGLGPNREQWKKVHVDCLYVCVADGAKTRKTDTSLSEGARRTRQKRFLQPIEERDYNAEVARKILWKRKRRPHIVCKELEDSL